MPRHHKTGFRAAVLAALAAASGGCGHLAYDRMVVDFDEATMTAVREAVVNPLELHSSGLLRQVRPSYVGVRWKL